MIKIVGIQFKGVGKVYYFDPLNYEFNTGEYAIVETVRGLELGKVIIGNRQIEDDELEYELKPVIRKASLKDVEQEEKNKELAENAYTIFKKYINVCKLEMKPLYAEYTIDQSKVIFYYCADDRVDFRELLRYLAPEFKIRVELRQIGPREAARAMGGIGTCGRELCCKTFLQNFDFVTMKMAKEQGMSLNNNKISGTCGKLMCCIQYEAELYKEMKKEFPAVGQFVKTPTCASCKVVAVDLFKRMVKTQEDSNIPVCHKLEEIEGFTIARKVEEPELIIQATIINNEIDVTIDELQDESIEHFEETSEVVETKPVENKEDNKKNKYYKRYKKKFKTNGKK